MLFKCAHLPDKITSTYIYTRRVCFMQRFKPNCELLGQYRYFTAFCKPTAKIALVSFPKMAEELLFYQMRLKQVEIVD